MEAVTNWANSSLGLLILSGKAVLWESAKSTLHMKLKIKKIQIIYSSQDFFSVVLKH